TASSLLRNRGILGLKFRRQHVVHGFIVDFYCAAERLVLELEGGAHDGPDQRAYDAARADVLEAAGFRVVRVRNAHVTRAGLETVLTPLSLSRSSPPVPVSVLTPCPCLGPHPLSPSPFGRGGTKDGLSLPAPAGRGDQRGEDKGERRTD